MRQAGERSWDMPRRGTSVVLLTNLHRTQKNVVFFRVTTYLDRRERLPAVDPLVRILAWYKKTPYMSIPLRRLGRVLCGLCRLLRILLSLLNDSVVVDILVHRITVVHFEMVIKGAKSRWGVGGQL